MSDNGGTQPGWDRRCWTVAILGIGITSALTVVGHTPASAAIIDRLIPIYIWGDDGAMLVGDIGFWIQFLVLPGLLAGLARRRGLLWSLLPSLGEPIDGVIMGLMAHQRPWLGEYLMPDQVAQRVIVCFTSAAIGLFIRFLARRVRRKGLAGQGKVDGTNYATVWPPPPSN